MTIFGAIHMFGFIAVSADLSIQVRHVPDGFGVFRTHNSRRHGNDPVTHDHDDRCQHLAQRSGGKDVAVSHRGQSHDTPVHRKRNIIKSILRTFDQVHQGSHDDTDDQDRKEEHKYLHPAVLYSSPEFVGFPDIVGRLQDPEDPEQPEGPDGEEEIVAAKEEHQVGRNGGQQIHYSIEAEDVGPRLPDGDHPQDVFNGKNNGDDPLCQVKYLEILYIQRSHTLQHDQCDTEYNDQKKGDIEELTRGGISLVDHFMQFVPPGCFRWFRYQINAFCRVKIGFLPEKIIIPRHSGE